MVATFNFFRNSFSTFVIRYRIDKEGNWEEESLFEIL